MSTATATAPASPWTKKASSGEGGDFERVPGGMYPACLVGLIDLGTHTNRNNKDGKPQRKVLLVWELVAEHDSKGETFKVEEQFTFSLNVKANLRAFLEGWEGRKFAEGEEINILSYVNRDCIVNVVEGLTEAGKKFAKVASASQPMKGMAVPKRSVEPFVWGFDGWDPRNDPPIPAWMPRTFGRPVLEVIKGSPEWSQLVPF